MEEFFMPSIATTFHTIEGGRETAMNKDLDAYYHHRTARTSTQRSVALAHW